MENLTIKLEDASPDELVLLKGMLRDVLERELIEKRLEALKQDIELENARLQSLDGNLMPALDVVFAGRKLGRSCCAAKLDRHPVTGQVTGITLTHPERK